MKNPPKSPTNPAPANRRRSERANMAAVATVLGLILSACVTVNVNFPESAVQKATDDYVRELYRAKAKGREEATPATPDKTSAWSPTAQALALLSDALTTQAHAQGIEAFKVKSGKTEGIQASMSGRVAEILKYKRSGAIGETNQGLLTIRGAENLKPIERKKVESLVAADNADRESLYAEVMAINSLPDEKKASLQSSFARSFQAESPSKTWVQDAGGQWEQKP